MLANPVVIPVYADPMIAVHWADRAELPIAFALTSLEVLVVVIEAALLHSATRGRVFTRGLPCTPLTWPRAVLVSFAGNVVSAAVSVVLPIGLVWLFERWWP